MQVFFFFFGELKKNVGLLIGFGVGNNYVHTQSALNAEGNCKNQDCQGLQANMRGHCTVLNVKRRAGAEAKLAKGLS